MYGIATFASNKGNKLYTSKFKIKCVKEYHSGKTAVEKYIHFYNYERFQSRFRGRSPMQARAEAMNTSSPVVYLIPENKRIKKYKEKFAA